MTDTKEFVSEDLEVLDSVSSSSSSRKIQTVFKTHRPEKEILGDVEEIVVEHDLSDYRELIIRGALLANNPEIIETENHTDLEKKAIVRERTHPILSLSRHMILAAISTSFAAINFEMDGSAIDGAIL